MCRATAEQVCTIVKASFLSPRRTGIGCLQLELSVWPLSLFLHSVPELPSPIICIVSLPLNGLLSMDLDHVELPGEETHTFTGVALGCAGWSRARGPCVCRTKDTCPMNCSAKVSQEEFGQVQWRDKPIHFAVQPLRTLSAGWRILTVFSSFRISIFIACLLPLGRGEKEKRTTFSFGKFKYEHVHFPFPPESPVVPATRRALECQSWRRVRNPIILLHFKHKETMAEDKDAWSTPRT